MSDQLFDAFGDRLGSVRPRPGEEAISAPSRFLARFGTTLFWAVVAAIVVTRAFVGV
jgi:hypothetical protein